MAGPKLKAVLAGYFGFGNAGDELILARMLESAPQVSWTVLSHNPRETSASHQVRCVNRWSLAALWSAFRQSDALVVGGGELFQTRTSLKSFFYYLGLVILAKVLGLDVWGFGMGIDPDMPAWAKKWTRTAFKGAKGLWARDRASAGWLAAQWVAPDPVWSWPVKPLQKAPGSRKVLWILRGRPQDAGFWADMLNGLSGRISSGLLMMHPESDAGFVSRVREGLRFFHQREDCREPSAVFDAIDGYDVVVSLRFHGVLAAALRGRPVLAIAGLPKVRELAHELGCPVVSPQEAAPESLHQAIREAMIPDPDKVLDFKARSGEALAQLSRLLIC